MKSNHHFGLYIMLNHQLSQKLNLLGCNEVARIIFVGSPPKGKRLILDLFIMCLALQRALPFLCRAFGEIGIP